jgi:hypothetical protein
MPDRRRGYWGAVIGIAVFLAGVGLVGLTFYLAYGQFTTPPDAMLDKTEDGAIDVGSAASLLMILIFKILLLLVMAALGSSISNRGIKLYGQGHQSRAEAAKAKAADASAKKAADQA